MRSYNAARHATARARTVGAPRDRIAAAMIVRHPVTGKPFSLAECTITPIPAK